MTNHADQPPASLDAGRFPITAGVLLGLGLGGFFDGIILHQVLQWHHMVSSAGYPINNLTNLEFNVMLDGLFHMSTYAFTAAGLFILWRAARHQHMRWSRASLFAAMLTGFGAFNLVEGVVDHHLLALHHVNETVDAKYWIYWDMGFLLGGTLMVFGGCIWMRKLRLVASKPRQHDV